ncbi:MAG: hypothetical protein CMF48_07270 [Legionellales bacterium]|nr:hypothetical protein [Legionellales bacterium]
MKELTSFELQHLSPQSLLTAITIAREGLNAIKEGQAFARELSQWWFELHHPDVLGQMIFTPYSSISAKGSL